MLINKEASTDLVLHSGGLVRPAGGRGREEEEEEEEEKKEREIRIRFLMLHGMQKQMRLLYQFIRFTKYDNSAICASMILLI